MTACEICGRTVQQGYTLYRQNATGVTGIWRCAAHNKKPVEQDVKEIVDAVETSWGNASSSDDYSSSYNSDNGE